MRKPEKLESANLREEIVAANGLIHRRALLRGALLSAGIAAASAGIARG